MAISYLKPKIFKIFREEALFNVNHSRKLKPLVRAVNKDPNMGLIASGCFHRHWFVNIIVNKEGTVKMKGVFKSIKHELKSKFPDLAIDEDYRILTSTYITMHEKDSGSYTIKYLPVYKMIIYVKGQKRKEIIKLFKETCESFKS
jgi:hypothetical protein